ncbi:DUF3953 domain-containing protein [Salicibibacter cibi]|uniref:DUF3953 domain-containing protein n=1 Tax=Salicibibacter cibi TaxID=2743001 RepID=A0A7T6Z8V4_9BACI|nr:DUF3953 domain-containing protein [Salicibibacter cibi]
MLAIIRIILAIIVFALAIYSLITGDYSVSPYTMLCLGALLFVTGISITREKYRVLGILLIIVSLFAFYVSIQDFLLS